MDEGQPTKNAPTDRELLNTALAQLTEDAHLYDEAVDSFNVHLTNHRERRALHDLPTRWPITTHGAFSSAIEGDRQSLLDLLTHLLDQNHLDSAVRRHPRVYPIHLEAIEHLVIARTQLIGTLESALRHLTSTE